MNALPPDILETADRLRRRMTARGWRLAVAESLTGGYLHWLVTSVAGASDYLEGGVVAYSLEQKVARLGVDRAHAEEANCVSPRVAREMAQGVARLMETDLAVATTGYASPDPQRGVAVPFAHVAVWRRRGEQSEALFEGRFEKAGSRLTVQQYVAQRALIELEKVVRQL